MRNFVAAALVGGLLTAVPASAQPPAAPSHDALTVVAGIYEHFLGRPPDESAPIWAQKIDNGTSPDDFLAFVLGSPEYYGLTGGAQDAYIHRMIFDLTGRQPTRDEFIRWDRRLVQTGDATTDMNRRTDLAYQVLRRYPQDYTAAPPPPVIPDRDRRDWERDRDRRNWDRDDNYDYRRPYYPPFRRDRPR
jgi:hypothetical protein